MHALNGTPPARPWGYCCIEAQGGFAPDPSAVWSADFRGVWHLSESPSGTAHDIRDSTANGFHGDSEASMDAADSVDTPLGRGVRFDGVDDRIEIENDDLLRFFVADDVTLTIRLRLDAIGTSTGPVHKSRAEGVGWGLRINGAGDFVFYTTSSTAFARGTATTGWDQVVLVRDAAAGERSIYHNGVLQGGPFLDPGTLFGAGTLWFGALNSGTEYFSGDLDEVRIAGVARSAAYVAAQYAAMTDAYLDFGDEEVF